MILSVLMIKNADEIKADCTNGRARYCFKCEVSVMTPSGVHLTDRIYDYLSTEEAAWIGDSLLLFDIRYLLLLTTEEGAERHSQLQKLTSNKYLGLWLQNLPDKYKHYLAHFPYKKSGSNHHSLGTHFEANYAVIRSLYLYSSFKQHHQLVDQLLSEHKVGLIPRYPFCPHFK